MVSRILVLSFILIVSNSCMLWKGMEVDFSDNTVPQGGLALVHLSSGGPGPLGALSGVFKGGGTVVAEESGGGAWAIVAADLESEAGYYHIIFKRGGKKISTRIRLVSVDFGTDRITLPRDMTEFDEPTLKRIKRESEVLDKVWAASAPARLWKGPFIMPLTGRISGTFGKRRILNGEERSPHGGLDIAAPRGAAVKASGGGRVAFVGNFFFYGNVVVLDHGLGVFTLYAHLDSILVKKGEALKAGQPVGYVGATGRATGPHLHFAVLVGRARVSPSGFIGLTRRLTRILDGESGRGARQRERRERGARFFKAS